MHAKKLAKNVPKKCKYENNRSIVYGRARTRKAKIKCLLKLTFH